MPATRLLIFAVLVCFIAKTVDGGQLSVVATEPAAHALTALTGTTITVEFDRPVDPATVDAGSFWAFGRWSGMVTGSVTFSRGDRRVTLQPDGVFSAGELVTVYLSNDLDGADGTSLRDAGYSFQFWTRVRQTAAQFKITDTLSTNQGAESSRPYGGIGSDMDGDGWLDISAVNEDTDDLRVFLNSGDGVGSFNTFEQPPAGAGQVPSPSEPSDFNRDGLIDVCLANTTDESVSVLLGNGDGTFASQQVIAVGNGPRGIAVLDADGDGDVDIVSANAGSGNLAIMLNNGAGVFGPATFFEGGGSGEWSLAAADMNSDGILDLVIGTATSDEILINLGNGDGTFSFASARSAGGRSWMLVVGDLDGDGDEDVATANSTTNNGAILLGDGQGGLAPAQTYSMDPFPLATDLGDVDGDGDLDWVNSSFQGDWTLLTNDGDGTFTFDREFPAPIAASCAVMLDTDNDGDLDLALLDEIADTIDLWRNSGTAVQADLNGDDAVNVQDLLILLSRWGPCPMPCPPICTGDFDLDCQVSTTDLLALLARWDP